MTTTPSVGAQYTLDNQVYEVVSINDGLISMCSLIHQYRRHVNFDLFASMEQRGTLCLHQRAPIDMSEAAQWVSLPEEEQKLVRHRVDYLNACDKEFGGKLPKKAAKVFVAKLATKLGIPTPKHLNFVVVEKALPGKQPKPICAAQALSDQQVKTHASLSRRIDQALHQNGLPAAGASHGDACL